MKRIVPFLLLAGCPAAGQPGPAAPSMPPAQAGPVAVLVSLDEEGAIPIACYAPDRPVTADLDACAAMIGDPVAAASPGGARVRLSGRGGMDCGGEDGAGLGMTVEAASRGDAGPVGELLIAPVARAEHVIPWIRGGELEDDVAAWYAQAGEAWTRQQIDDPDMDFVPAPRLAGTLTADFDGDLQPDVVYTVHPDGGTDADGHVLIGDGPRLLLARLSGRGELVELLGTDFENPTAFAAFELDGQGGVELFYDMPYYEGDSINLARIVDGRLEAIGGYGCGH